jgi:hypothetical protein
MADIYVPIDFSNARDVIPPGEDIIYSTMCAGKGEFLDGTKSITYKWLSHFLLTDKGVAFTIPLKVSHTKKQIKKLNPREEHYLEWHNINVFPGRTGDKPGFTIDKIENEIKITCFLELVPNPEFESDEKFQERKQLFFNRFKPVQEQKRKEMLDKFYEFKKENPDVSWFNEDSRKEILKLFPINDSIFYEVANRISKEEKAAKKAEKQRLKEEKKRQKAAKKAK